MKRRALLGTALAASLPLSALAQTPPTMAVPLATPPDPEQPQLDDVVASAYQRLVMARWGDPVLPDAPPFSPNAPNESASAAQFGWDGVIAGIVTPPPAQDGVQRIVMVVAHPDVTARMAFPGGIDHPRTAGKMQGASVLNFSYRGGRWVVVDGGYQSRRMTDDTLCQVTGPAAATIGATVQGVIAPAAGCLTPWNSVLLAEGDAAIWFDRLAKVDQAYSDPAVAPLFSWVTEIDALSPGSFPNKHTALGRFPRAGIAAGLSHDGRAVIFMTDASPNGFLLRFTGAAAAGDGSTALDAGTLAVAVIDGSSITWKDLGSDIPTLTATISAAAAAGGSGFDRPTGLALAPDGTLYLACRGNEARSETNPLNPRAGNGSGHIIAFTHDGGDPAAAHATGQILLLAGNPSNDSTARYAPGSPAWLRCPATLNLDPHGTLWIGTDQDGRQLDTADGLFTLSPPLRLLNNAYLAPLGAAIGAAGFTSDTVFAMVRHPGDTPSSSFDQPITRWPTLNPSMPPQSTMIGLTRRI
ncbi:MAG TPA: DUF839 domain-containing protein [Acetobacteraceae bacterium]|nr:DUF839 domain-containing protein [Acetobacteraceae bacterium]